MKLITTSLVLGAVSGFPTFGLLKKQKQPEPLNDEFTRAFARMDEALTRAFAIPVLEADVFHLPGGQQFMTPLRPRNTLFDAIMGFPMAEYQPQPSQSERFVQIGETTDDESTEHDDEKHSTTTKHKYTKTMLDKVTGESRLKTTKTTDVVSDDGKSHMQMVVSSFDGDDAQVDEEDLPARHFADQTYIDNMINKWYGLLNTPQNQLDSLESVMRKRADLESRKAQLDNELKQVEAAEQKLKSLLEENEAPEDDETDEDAQPQDPKKFEWLNEFGEKKFHEVQPDEDHITFGGEKKTEEVVVDSEPEVEEVETDSEPEAETVETESEPEAEKTPLDEKEEKASIVEPENQTADVEEKPEIVEAVLEEETPKLIKKPVRKRKQRKHKKPTVH